MNLEAVVSEISAKLPESQAVLLNLALVLEGENAPSVLQFMPEADYQALSPYIEKILAYSERDRHFPLLDEIHKLSHKKVYYGIDEMEGSWILHYLKDEKPAVIALILKHLPADKVYQILTRMEPVLRERLPDADALDRVPDDLVEIVRLGFEEKLVGFTPPTQFRSLEFRCVRNLNCNDLTSLVADLGVDILSLAFQGVGERSLIELVKNLDEDDAERLFDKFNEHRGANRSEVKTAQLEILGLSLTFKNGSELIMEAGVQRLAKALSHSPEDLIVVLQHKIPFKSGVQLRRYVDDFRRANNPDAVVKKLQDFIVGRIVELSKTGVIDGEWARMKKRMN